LLITEEELIVPLIGTIIDHLVIARVISIFLNLYISVDNAELRRGGNKKYRSFICGAFTIGVNKVDKGWYPYKVDDLVIFGEGAQGFFLTCCIGKRGNGRQQIVSPSPYSIRKQGVSLSIAQDSPTETSDTFNLF
jgi:hypothetical protein